MYFLFSKSGIFIGDIFSNVVVFQLHDPKVFMLPCAIDVIPSTIGKEFYFGNAVWKLFTIRRLENIHWLALKIHIDVNTCIDNFENKILNSKLYIEF